MISLSSAQWAMLRKLPAVVPLEEAVQLKQTTFGSFGRPSRGYYKKQGNKFLRTSEADRVAQEFGHDEIYRKTSGQISIYFRETLKKR